MSSGWEEFERRTLPDLLSQLGELTQELHEGCSQGACNLCSQGFRRKEVHYGSQSLGMIPDTDCRRVRTDADQRETTAHAASVVATQAAEKWRELKFILADLMAGALGRALIRYDTHGWFACDWCGASLTAHVIRRVGETEPAPLEFVHSADCKGVKMLEAAARLQAAWKGEGDGQVEA